LPWLLVRHRKRKHLGGESKPTTSEQTALKTSEPIVEKSESIIPEDDRFKQIAEDTQRAAQNYINQRETEPKGDENQAVLDKAARLIIHVPTKELEKVIEEPEVKNLGDAILGEQALAQQGDRSLDTSPDQNRLKIGLSITGGVMMIGFGVVAAQGIWESVNLNKNSVVLNRLDKLSTAVNEVEIAKSNVDKILEQALIHGDFEKFEADFFAAIDNTLEKKKKLDALATPEQRALSNAGAYEDGKKLNVQKIDELVSTKKGEFTLEKTKVKTQKLVGLVGFIVGAALLVAGQSLGSSLADGTNTSAYSRWQAVNDTLELRMWALRQKKGI